MRRSPGVGRRRVALRAARSALLPGLLAALALAAPARGAEVDEYVGRPVVAVELHSGGAPLRDRREPIHSAIRSAEDGGSEAGVAAGASRIPGSSNADS